jgi:hypothetical protein
VLHLLRIRCRLGGCGSSWRSSGNWGIVRAIRRRDDDSAKRLLDPQGFLEALNRASRQPLGNPRPIDGDKPALLAIHLSHHSDKPLEILKYRVAPFSPCAPNKLLKDDPPGHGHLSEETPEQLDVKVPTAAEQAKRFKVVADVRPGRVRDRHSVAESYEDRELVAIHSFLFEFSGVCRDLLDRTAALGDADLAVYRDKRNGEGRELERGPEPLRAWPDEGHTLGVDERHARTSVPLAGWSARYRAPLRCQRTDKRSRHCLRARPIRCPTAIRPQPRALRRSRPDTTLRCPALRR